LFNLPALAAIFGAYPKKLSIFYTIVRGISGGKDKRTSVGTGFGGLDQTVFLQLLCMISIENPPEISSKFNDILTMSKKYG